MLLIYLLLAAIGLALFGIAGSGALVAGLFGYRLNRYRYRYLGLADRRWFIARLWRLGKFSLYQPVVCIALALFFVCLLSLVLKPLAVGGFLGSGKGETEAAIQVGTWENRLYTLTEWLDNGALVNGILVVTLTLLVVNLVWPNITIFHEVPRMRGRIRSIMIFLTTVSAFTFVSAGSINANRAAVTADLRKDVLHNEEDIHRFHSESAALQLVTDSIKEMSPEDIRKLAFVVQTVVAADAAKDVSASLGKDAGDKMKQRYEIPPTDRRVARDRASALDDIKDWPSLAERRARSSSRARRAELLKRASRESMLASLDKLGGQIADHLGGPVNRATKVVIGAFFSSMAESVTELCSRIRPSKIGASDEDILEQLSRRPATADPDKVPSRWLNAIAEGSDPETMASSLSKRLETIDADIKLKSAAKAAKAAETAADAAKAAKAAKSLLKVLF